MESTDLLLAFSSSPEFVCKPPKLLSEGLEISIEPVQTIFRVVVKVFAGLPYWLELYLNRVTILMLNNISSTLVVLVPYYLAKSLGLFVFI